MLNTFCGVLTGGAVAIRHIAFKAQHRTSSQTVGANTAAQDVHNDVLIDKSLVSNYQITLSKHSTERVIRLKVQIQLYKTWLCIMIYCLVKASAPNTQK